MFKYDDNKIYIIPKEDKPLRVVFEDGADVTISEDGECVFAIDRFKVSKGDIEELIEHCIKLQWENWTFYMKARENMKLVTVDIEFHKLILEKLNENEDTQYEYIKILNCEYLDNGYVRVNLLADNDHVSSLYMRAINMNDKFLKIDSIK